MMRLKAVEGLNEAVEYEDIFRKITVCITKRCF